MPKFVFLLTDLALLFLLLGMGVDSPRPAYTHAAPDLAACVA